MKCSWIYKDRINQNRVEPHSCPHPAKLRIVNPHYGETGYCYRHFGMAIELAARYIDTQFSNMNGDKIEKVGKNDPH